jgi:2-polyprenyl-3-methyl-5-hydroxy-6-metoxy-1,4-benzoquinol methylase
MSQEPKVTVKKNVSTFDNDVRTTGSYKYTADRLSSRLAISRFTQCIAESFDFGGTRVLDLGCGDGTYTVEFSKLGVKEIVGVDPATSAVASATMRARHLGVDGVVRFEVGNIYEMGLCLAGNRFDCIVLRGVLHHLPDPEKAIAGLSGFTGTIIVLEPNGNNPVLKLLEKYSRYHIEHEERSFSPSRIESWLTAAGFGIRSSRVFNLVPMFCPDWMAEILRVASPPVERVPLLRDIACGQSLIVARA